MARAQHEKTLAHALKHPLRAFPGVLAVVGLASLGVNLLMLTGPLFMLQIYDRVLPANSVETLLALLLLVVVLYVGLGGLDMARGRLLSRMAARLHARLRPQLYDVVSLRALTEGESAASQPMQAFNSITGFLGGPALSVLFDVPMMLVFLGVMYMLHPWFLYFGLAAAVILFLIAVLNHLMSLEPQKQAMQAASRSSALLGAGLRHMEALKALGMRRRFYDRWAKEHDRVIFWDSRSRERISGFAAGSKAFRLLLQSLILALGAWLVIRGEITAGAMIVASILLGRALQPVEQSITLWQGYQRFRVARKRLLGFLRKQEDKGAARATVVPEDKPTGRLTVKELVAVPPGAERPALQGVMFNLPPGKLLWVTGANGSGKTTLARVCAGIWEPARGQVLLDDAELHAWPEEALGRLIGYVPQDPHLLDGTVAENIARFEEDPDEAEVLEAARRARVHHVMKAIGGYDVRVGVDGGRLPAGIRQRIALARAMYGDPVLLIMDEPASNLDAQGRRELLLALQELKERGRAILVIDHDPHIEAVADAVMVLQNGTVAEFRQVKRDEQAKLEERNAAADSKEKTQ